MIKTIKITKSQSVELSGSAGWLLIYRETFGHDILPDIMPMIESTLSLAVEILQGSTISVDKNGISEIDVNSVISNLDGGVLSSLFINLSGLESTTLLRIIWAMAKHADDDTPSILEFYKQFENFPLDVVVPKAVRLIIDSTVSAKNARRLLSLRKIAAGLPQTKYSLQGSTEG